MTSRSKQWFYNYFLGMPMVDANLTLADGDIEKAGRFPDMLQNRGDYSIVTAGIDWGREFHNIVIMGMRENGSQDVIATFEIHGVGNTDVDRTDADIAEIRLKLMPYTPDFILCDWGDAGEKINRLISIYGKDKVFACKYSTNPKNGYMASSKQIEPTWNEKDHTVTVDKLTQNKRIISMFKHQEIGIWRRHDQELLLYMEHWKNVIIRDEEDDDGNPKQVIGRKGPDHKAQSTVLAMLALDRVKEEFFGDNTYGFDYTTLSSVQPEKTDLKKLMDENKISLYD